MKPTQGNSRDLIGNRGSLTPSPHNTLCAGPHRAFPEKCLEWTGRLAPAHPNAGYCVNIANDPKPGRVRNHCGHRGQALHFTLPSDNGGRSVKRKV